MEGARESICPANLLLLHPACLLCLDQLLLLHAQHLPPSLLLHGCHLSLEGRQRRRHGGSRSRARHGITGEMTLPGCNYIYILSEEQ